MCVKLILQLFGSFTLYHYQEGKFQRQTISIFRTSAASLTTVFQTLYFPHAFILSLWSLL